MIREVESDAVKRHDAHLAEDVEMDLTRADIPDDEFFEESHVEEVRVPKGIHDAVKLAIMRIHRNLGHSIKELLCRALRMGGANEIAIRALNSSATFVRRTILRKVTCFRSWQTHTPNSIKV